MNANGSNPISITQSNPQQPPPQPGSIPHSFVSAAATQLDHQQSAQLIDQQQYYPSRNTAQQATTIYLPENTRITRSTNNLVNVQFPPTMGVSPIMPQTSYAGMNVAYPPYYQNFSYGQAVPQDPMAQHPPPMYSQQSQLSHQGMPPGTVQSQAQQMQQAHHQTHSGHGHGQTPPQQQSQGGTPHPPPISQTSSQPSARPRKVLQIMDPDTKAVINPNEVGESQTTASRKSPSVPPTELPPEQEKTDAGRKLYEMVCDMVISEDGKEKTPVTKLVPAAAETDSTTTTTTTTTVEAAATRGAHTASTDSREAAADENEVVGTLKAPKSGQKKEDSLTTTEAVGTSTRDIKEKTKSQSSKETSSPPLQTQESRESTRASSEDYRKHIGENGEFTPPPSILVAEHQTRERSLDPHRRSGSTEIGTKADDYRSPSREIDIRAENGRTPPIENGISEETPETTAASEQEDQETKIREYEDKMARLLQDPDEAKNVSALVYSQNFLYLMRNIVKELRLVKCPKSETELVEIGIDKAGMPQQNRPTPRRYTEFNSKQDSFALSWQPQQRAALQPNKQAYPGRFSQGKDGRNKKHITGRGSMQPRNEPPQPTLPPRAENAWMPRREAERVKPVDDQDARYEALKKEVRGLLNKITPNTYEKMAEQFCELKVHEDLKLLPMIIDLIFEKAVEEPRFCPLYSDLCQKQVEMENNLPAEQKPEQKSSFRANIIQKCQQTFTGATNSDEQIKNMETELAAETDEAKRKEKEERIDLLKSKEKRRLLGIIKFIAQLYRHNLLINMIINWCVVELVKRYDATNDEAYVEYATQMIETIGPTYERNRKKKQQLQQIFSHLSGIKSKLSNRVRFMIMNLEDLKRKNWVSKHGNQGPKTMDQVRIEAEQEQKDNQAERDAWDKKKKESSGPDQFKKPGSRPSGGYGGRGSNDARSYPRMEDKRLAAGLSASSASSSTAPRKDIGGLKSMETTKLGLNRPVWRPRAQQQHTDSQSTSGPILNNPASERNSVGPQSSGSPPSHSVTPPPTHASTTNTTAAARDASPANNAEDSQK
ncbi:hypothetical protein Ddc_04649 [Ditylenchus destructor]|nr:hypothetical protein Ddc_04649 [Ditylenchus destructor]